MFKTAGICTLVLPLIFFGVLAGGLSSSELQPQQPDSPKLSVGPAEGESAPRFKAHDQFGGEQTNRTVAGKNGTVLLFFRSADW